MEAQKISFILCTYNGERTLNDCLRSLVNQDYPKERMEILIADGGSKDKTLGISEKYKKKYPKMIKIGHNPAQYDDGKRAGKDSFSRKSTGSIICFIDQDNILIQKDWIKRMLKPFQNNEIAAVQSRMAVMKNDSMINKYLSAIGIEDPFNIPISLNAQLLFNPGRFSYDKKGDYFVFKLSRDNYLYGGNNGFMIKRKEFFESGGYVQDTDNFERMALKNYKVAVPNNAKLHHSAATDFIHMIKKRTKYVIRYLEENFENREHYWFNLKKNSFAQNFNFIKTVLFNMLILPGFCQSIFMMIKTKQLFWILHPIMLFSVTLSYIAGTFYSLFNRKILKKGFRIDMTKQNA